jgi:hypothetical protein
MWGVRRSWGRRTGRQAELGAAALVGATTGRVGGGGGGQGGGRSSGVGMSDRDGTARGNTSEKVRPIFWSHFVPDLEGIFPFVESLCSAPFQPNMRKVELSRSVPLYS